MNPVVRSRLPIRAAITVLIAICPAPAGAHLNATGMGPVYDGMAHFLMSPEDFVPVLALALLAGMRGASYGRRALFVLPAAWLLGGFVGLPESATTGSAVLSAVWFLVLGGLLAVDVQVPLLLTTLLAVVLGLDKGYLNGAGLGQLETAAAALAGLVSAVFVIVVLQAHSWSRCGRSGRESPFESLEAG